MCPSRQRQSSAAGGNQGLTAILPKRAGESRPFFYLVADLKVGDLSSIGSPGQPVGWVERSDTHHCAARRDDGFRKGSTHPTPLWVISAARFDGGGVRFAPDNGHEAASSACPLAAVTWTLRQLPPSARPHRSSMRRLLYRLRMSRIPSCRPERHSKSGFAHS